MYVYACMYVCMIEEHRTPTEHKTTGKAEKPAYIGKFADNEKKYKKKSKKIWKYEKRL